MIILCVLAIIRETMKQKLACLKAVNTKPTYSTFKSHKSHKHSLHFLIDFKDSVVQGTCETETAEPGVSNSEEFCDDSQPDEVHLDMLNKKKVATVLLKLENIFHVPSAAVDELLEEIQYLLSTASLCNTRNVLHDTLKSYDLQVDPSVIEELASVLCTSTPVYKSIGKGRPWQHPLCAKSTTKTILQTIYLG